MGKKTWSIRNRKDEDFPGCELLVQENPNIPLEHTPGIPKPPNDSGIPNHKPLKFRVWGMLTRGMLENS